MCSTWQLTLVLQLHHCCAVCVVWLCYHLIVLDCKKFFQVYCSSSTCYSIVRVSFLSGPCGWDFRVLTLCFSLAGLNNACFPFYDYRCHYHLWLWNVCGRVLNSLQLVISNCHCDTFLTWLLRERDQDMLYWARCWYSLNGRTLMSCGFGTVVTI